MSTSSINPLSSMTDALAGSNAGSGTTTTSSSGNSSTTGTGLGQGINVQQFVQYAVANQQATITNLQNQESALGTQNNELSTIAADFTTLDNAVQALNDPMGAMNALAATSSNPNELAASISSSASAGYHTIEVNSLATTATAYSDEVPSATTALTGTLSITPFGASQAISVPTDATDGTTTLNGLVAYINSHSNLGVTASVVQDANGARLALVSDTGGTNGSFTATASLSYTDAQRNTATAGFNVGTPGKNGSISVDGVPVATTSNTVTDAIPGVTLNLSPSAGPGSTFSLQIAPDMSQATAAINSFVNAYNAVTTEINNQFNVTSTGGGGPLENDNTLRQAQSMLLNAISYSMTGNNGIVNLASMGIDMNDDGTLTVNNSTLASALATNSSAVQNFFQNATNGFAAQLDNAIQTINAPSNGMLSIDSQSNSTMVQQLNQQITDLQAQLVVQEQQLTATYAQVNTTLQELPMLENQLSQQLAGIA
jgi:flagellar hook-associated protein 2